MSVDDFLQLGFHGVVNGTAYALTGVAFWLIWNVTQRFHFALALTYTLSAYVAAETSHWGGGLWPAIVIGAAVGAVLGALIEDGVYRPLATRSGGDALLTVFIASLGLGIVGQNLISLIWISSPSQQISGVPLDVLSERPVNVTVLDLELVIASWVLIVALWVGLARTPWGRMVRAVRANPEMATVVGIDSRLVYAAVFGAGSFLAGVSAVFDGAKTAVTPEMGFQPMFYSFVVAFLAGSTRSPASVGLVGIALGLLESWSGMLFAAQWASLAVFGVLFIYVAQKAMDPRSIIRRLARGF